MKIKKYLLIFAVVVFIAGIRGPGVLNAQQEVRIQITEGMPMIPVALPDFTPGTSSISDEDTKNEVYRVLWNDLTYSRVFKLVPKEYTRIFKNLTPVISVLKIGPQSRPTY